MKLTLKNNEKRKVNSPYFPGSASDYTENTSGSNGITEIWRKDDKVPDSRFYCSNRNKTA